VAGLDKVNLDYRGLFDYDPSQGNLLLDISFENASHSGPLAFYQSLRGGPIARGFGSPSSDQTAGTQGLVVEFVEPVPEPSTTLSLFLVGVFASLIWRFSKSLSCR
jgi:hypothetical protein